VDSDNSTLSEVYQVLLVQFHGTAAWRSQNDPGRAPWPRIRILVLVGGGSSCNDFAPL